MFTLQGFVESWCITVTMLEIISRNISTRRTVRYTTGIEEVLQTVFLQLRWSARPNCWWVRSERISHDILPQLRYSWKFVRCSWCSSVLNTTTAVLARAFHVSWVGTGIVLRDTLTSLVVRVSNNEHLFQRWMGSERFGLTTRLGRFWNKRITRKSNAEDCLPTDTYLDWCIVG